MQYYSLDVTFFKSSLDSHMLDLLWNKYWVNTLSASPLISNREFAAGQIADVAEKLEQVRWEYKLGTAIKGFCKDGAMLWAGDYD